MNTAIETAKPHVLIVDDDQEIRTLLSKFLSKHDYRVTTAKDGREMREALKNWKIDLIVLDLMMPLLDGESTLHEMRRNIWPYIFISPFYFLYAVFGIFPLIFGLWLSFHTWDGISAREWVGLENYIRLMTDDIWWKAIYNTLWLFFVATVPQLTLALLLAFIINSPNIRGKDVLRAAYFMPIVASMGGIGTTQTATVVIRGIALGHLTAGVLARVLRKELWRAASTGVINGLVLAVIAYAWKGRWLLAVILGVALLLNLLVAAVIGTLVPIVLRAFRIDPAIASGVIITTFTDVFGFFSFLGLATLLIAYLL